MLKFNTAEIVRIVENTKGLDNDDVVLAMLEDDDVVTSTMTLHLPTQIKNDSGLIALKQMTEEQANNTQFTVPEWGYFINEDYPGWQILHLSNKE